ncbi:MAG TPA: hypothetical protein VK669_02400 [Candidatus Limnocylindrales bacterium]|nr:hypothetical protein [Candidatus Limnocylindrales bacterium]
MADRVFGPHVTGFHFLGVAIGATTEVDRDSSGGKNVPESLSVVLSSPLGQTSTIASVANGQTTTVQVTPGVSVTATIDDCRTVPAQAPAPELFEFKVTLRASGTVKVGFLPIPIPGSIQIDAFDVHVPTDDAAHAELMAAHTQEEAPTT